MRLPFLEGLRAVAALYVVVSHCCSMADGRRTVGMASHSPPWLLDIFNWLTRGNLAVASFIVISGFCLQLSLYQRSDGQIAKLSKFYKRRALRILPPYYAALLISIAVALNVTQYQHTPPFTLYVPVGQTEIVTHALLIHNFNVNWMYKINGVMWSIALEAQLYVLFPILVWAFREMGRLPALILSGALAVSIVQNVPGAPKLYPWYLPQFVMGMVAASLVFRPVFRTEAQVWIARILGFAAAYATFQYAVQRAPLHIQDPSIGLAVACLCYVMTAAPKGIGARILSLKPLVSIGAFSYSLYLMHHPIMQLVFVNRPAWVNDEVSSFRYLLVVAIPLILVGTYIFYLLFERPFLPRRPLTRGDDAPGTPLSLPLRAYGLRSQIPMDPAEEQRQRTAALFSDGYQFPP